MKIFEKLRFKKSDPPRKEAKIAADKLCLSGPAYYEVWGGIERANRVLWVAVWFSIAVGLLALLMVRLQIRKPPIIIAFAGSGAATVINSDGRQPPVSEAEIKNFLALFEKFFTELDSYTYAGNLKLAFGMMTPEFQPKANDWLKSKSIVEKLQAETIKTVLLLGDLQVVQDTHDIIECKVRGTRNIFSFKSDSPTMETIFEDDIVLKKVPRSEQTPYGVLVENFSERPFK